MTEKCVCMLYKTKYALRVEAFFTSIQKQAAVDTRTLCHSDLDAPYGQQQPADHSPEPSSHTDFSNTSPYGNLMRISQKSLIVKNNPGTKPVVLWVQSSHLLPASFGCRVLWLSQYKAGRASYQ